MSYRRITVGGINYRYVIGKQFIKIVTDGKPNQTIPKSRIGIEHRDGGFIIKPKMISDYLMNGKIGSPENYFPSCSHTNSKRTIRALPFENEIENKRLYRYYCEDCFLVSEYEI